MAEFFLDHNVAFDIAIQLRRAGHAARTARDLGLTRSRDHEILTISASNRWVVVTHNARDFDLLHRAWRQWPRTWQVEPPPAHAGILVFFPRLPAPVAAQEISGLLASTPDLTNRHFTWRTVRGWIPHEIDFEQA